LTTSANIGPTDARELLAEYLKVRNDQRQSRSAGYFANPSRKQFVAVLNPLLDNRTEISKEVYLFSLDDGLPKLPLRVCDLAAWVIAQHRRETTFDASKNRQDCDKQITEMKRKLPKTPANRARGWPSGPAFGSCLPLYPAIRFRSR